MEKDPTNGEIYSDGSRSVLNFATATNYVEHSVLGLISQRVYGICLGYEDLNDHEELRKDPLLATLVGKSDPTGLDRLRDSGCPLAGKSTLNR